MLRTDEAASHLLMVTEAVRRSVAEVFAASRGRATPLEERAEWLIPHPLAAGELPRSSDESVDGSPSPATLPNHFPMYWLLPNGKLAERIGDRSTSRYRYKIGRYDTVVDLGRPLADLGPHEVVAEDEPAAEVARRLVDTAAPYLRWFASAGASGVIAPAIDVLSEAGADLVEAFYGHTEAGTGVGEAMRRVREQALGGDHIGAAPPTRRRRRRRGIRGRSAGLGRPAWESRE